MLVVVANAQGLKGDRDKKKEKKSESISAQKMNVGTNFFSIGIGPRSSYHSYHTKGTPAIRISFDHGLKEIGPGVLTLGGTFGFFADHYSSTYGWWDNNGYHTQAYKENWMYLLGAVRVGYYYNFKELGIPKLNAYAGIATGARFRIYSDNYNGPSGFSPSGNSGAEFHMGAYGGANYFVTKKIAFFTEFGYDFSPITAGVTIHL